MKYWSDMGESEKHANSKRAGVKTIYYMIPFIWNPKTGKTALWCQKAERGICGGWAVDIKGVKNFFLQ